MPPLTPAVVHVLLALAGGERHGYADSQGRATRVGQPAALWTWDDLQHVQRLMESGWVEEAPAPPADVDERRVRRLTCKGRGVGQEVDRSPSLLDVGARIESTRTSGGCTHGIRFLKSVELHAVSGCAVAFLAPSARTRGRWHATSTRRARKWTAPARSVVRAGIAIDLVRDIARAARSAPAAHLRRRFITSQSRSPKRGRHRRRASIRRGQHRERGRSDRPVHGPDLGRLDRANDSAEPLGRPVTRPAPMVAVRAAGVRQPHEAVRRPVRSIRVTLISPGEHRRLSRAERIR